MEEAEGLGLSGLVEGILMLLWSARRLCSQESFGSEKNGFHTHDHSRGVVFIGDSPRARPRQATWTNNVTVA